MNNKQVYAIGADIGGTHISAAVVDLEERKVLPTTLVRQHLNSKAAAREIIERWAVAIEECGKSHRLEKVSLAIPGPFNYTDGICLIKDQDKYESLYGLNIKEIFAARLGIAAKQISLVNDAASFLQGEVFCGAAKGFHDAIGITLGTGLGTCSFKNEIATDANLWASPFLKGIAEDYLCTRWFVKRYFEVYGKQVSGVRTLISLMDKEPNIQLIFDEFGTNLAAFIKQFISGQIPEVVILGGNIAKSLRLFQKTLNATLQMEFPKLRIQTAQLGEQAAIIGAASYWRHATISSNPYI